MLNFPTSKFLLHASVAALTVTLAGCGGDGGGSSNNAANMKGTAFSTFLGAEDEQGLEMPDTSDATQFNLKRFVEAQNPIYENVLNELRAGNKKTHWMWFIFPQLLGLGQSEIAKEFGITGLEEAQAYLKHPVLGARLRECFALLLNHKDLSALQILHSPDDLKLKSSATLFLQASPDEQLFQDILDQFYAGKTDPLTLELLLKNTQ